MSSSANQSSSKKIIFKCDQHAAIISEKLQSFYKENEFFDTVLIAGNNQLEISIQAHRVVLCAFSDYFLETFRGNQSALIGNVVEIKEIETSTLKLIIDFMYSSSIELSIETVGGILRTASFLKIKSLVVGCCELIEKNIDSRNCLSWFRIAYELSLPTLKSKSLECTYTYFEEVSKEEELLMLSENELKDLLFNENPHGDIEEDVFLAMIAWINYDKSNRGNLVLQLLSMVRFHALTPKFIVENRKSVCKNVESYELICSWLEWHLSPETRSSDQQNFTFNPRKEKKKKKKVAAVCYLNDGFNIETFNTEENSWTIERKIHYAGKERKRRVFFPMIEINSKLILYKDLFCKYIVAAEYFDLCTSEWIDLPLMKKNRTSVELADLNGNLCVLGTEKDDSYSMEMYNFSTREWHDLYPPCQLSSQSIMASHNEMLYIIDSPQGLLQSYNLTSNKWTLKKTTSEPLFNFGFVAVDGFLYIIGGYRSDKSKHVKTVRRYNLSNDSWSEMASLPHARDHRIKSTVFESKIVILSDGENVDEYDVNTDTWKTLSSLKKDYRSILLTWHDIITSI